MNSSKIRRKSELGQVFTPPYVAELMAKLLTDFEPKKVLDPAVGEGALLTAVDSYCKVDELIGYDIDNEWIRKLREEGLNVEIKDFFDSCEKYDGIIMNPPYIRQEKLNNPSVEFLNKEVILKKLGYPDISKKANLYLYFLWKALFSLKDSNSCIVGIMPNTWLESAYGQTLQELILSNFSVKCIVNFNDNVFEGFDVDVSIFVIKNEWLYNNVISIFDVDKKLTSSNIEQILRKEISDRNLSLHYVNQKDLAPFTWYDYRNKINFNFENLSTIKEHFIVNRGITTNYNSFFIRDAEEQIVADHNEYFLPILNKAKEVKGYSLNIRELNKVLFYTRKNRIELPKGIQLEIEKCENMLLETEKPKTVYNKFRKYPDNWFNLSKAVNKSIVFNYIIRDEVRFMLNDSKAIVKDNFYEMIPSRKVDYEYYIAVLNSTFNKYFLEKNGRSYGTGLLKIQKYELDQVPFLDINRINSDNLQKLKDLGRDLLIGKTSEVIIKKIDIILSEYYLQDINMLNNFYKQYAEIKTLRKGNNNG